MCEELIGLIIIIAGIIIVLFFNFLNLIFD